ncbi:response regulator transcription factor [Robertmurraya andreesenii]|uniref:DNA-binding response OmpR family regulator n=1 Tax=Anoxybacillus andreesenii TaxID=1325932 RepID=A0ABT9V468_9BACL|nr:response regulator [Robertmurraya andreesenii]MDQ0155743.1 DNA-binding response OmpR family regulator [Robertmurraya andreesenii]
MDKRILIIEDEESIVDILAYALRKEGFSVLSASTGKAAIARFQGSEIDLVISNYGMFTNGSSKYAKNSHD